jgi:cytochrome c oxidase subunit 4
MAHQPSHQPLDQLDPHHELVHEHGEHVILRMSTLGGVLAALLFLTILTVAQARAEIWANETFHIHIPQIINALIVLAIAVVKASLVAMFFMQLKYDSPLNGVVLIACLSGVALFLGLSMIDLGMRSTIEDYKSGEIQKGGLGLSVPGRVNTGNKPITEWARTARIQHIQDLADQKKIDLAGRTPEQYYWEVERPHFVHSHVSHEPARSTAQQSRPPEPLGPALYAPPEEHAPAHGGGH